ncbi:MAG: F0F1 ATP synthase subunit A, partial [Firmicutes bacterium]|nr:F0F1 ATP synthase subunit A [Bacillota bacterium]
VMITSLAITIILVVIAILATRHMKERPTGLQNAMEKFIEVLHNFLSDIVGAKHIDKYFPYLCTLFMFILLSNYCGLIPFCGRIPGFAAPTSVINVTAGLAICTFCLTHYSGLRYNGLGYGKHFIRPFVFILPLLIIDELVHPLSLTLRLFGNVFGEESVTEEIFNLLPVVAPTLLQALSVLMGLIQAMVFVMLSAFYIGEAIGDEE